MTEFRLKKADFRRFFGEVCHSGTASWVILTQMGKSWAGAVGKSPGRLAVPNRYVSNMILILMIRLV